MIQAPHPLVALVQLANSPDEMARIYAEIRQIHPAFPEYSSTLVLWRLLQKAGLPCPFDPIPGCMQDLLSMAGVRQICRDERPRAGDLFAADRPGVTVELGVVAKVPIPVAGVQPDWFAAVDHSLGPDHQPYRRKVTGDPERLDIARWLRFG